MVHRSPQNQICLHLHKTGADVLLDATTRKLGITRFLDSHCGTFRPYVTRAAVSLVATSVKISPRHLQHKDFAANVYTVVNGCQCSASSPRVQAWIFNTALDSRRL